MKLNDVALLAANGKISDRDKEKIRWRNARELFRLG